MKLAINPATTMPTGLEDDLAAYSQAGFEAMEIWLGKVDAYLEKGHSVEDARRLLDEHGLAAAGACFWGLTFSGDEEERKSVEALKDRLEMCQALGAQTLVVIPRVPGPVNEDSYERVADGLRRCGEMAEPFGLSLAIEFIKGAELLGSVRTATRVARSSGRENVGVLLDTFHFSAGISKVCSIREMSADELKLVHLNDCRDVPLEMATDRMRVFPGDGVLPLGEIFSALRDINYQGYVSLELFCEDVWEMDVKEAARLSYDKATAFMDEHAS